MELLWEINISKITLKFFVKRIDLNYFTYKRKIFLKEMTKLENCMNTIEFGQLVFENTNCVFNKLIDSREKSYFRNFKFLIEHLNSVQSNTGN